MYSIVSVLACILFRHCNRAASELLNQCFDFECSHNSRFQFNKCRTESNFCGRNRKIKRGERSVTLYTKHRLIAQIEACDYWFNPSIVASWSLSKPNSFLALLLRGGVAMRCTAEWLRRSVTRWWIKLGVLSGRRTRTRHCTTAWFGISYPWHLPSLTKPCPAFLTFVDHLWLSCVGGVQLITNCYIHNLDQVWGEG